MKKITFSALSLSLSMAGLTSARADSMAAWSSPDWGFVRPSTQVIPAVKNESLKNSLVFDQPFDTHAVLPLPQSTPVANEKIFVSPVNPFTVAKSPQLKKAPQPEKPAEKVSALPIAPVKPVAVSAPIEQPLQSLDSKVSAQLGDFLDQKWARASIERGHLKVVDEESLSTQSPRAVQGAEVFWMGLESGIKSISNRKGIAVVPSWISHSARFIVKAKGYLPAVGYAWNGQVTPVVLYRESRVPGVAQSVLLDITRKVNSFPYPNASTVFGKVVSPEGSPLKGAWIDTSLQEPHKLFYSMGSLGLFHPRMESTGVQGDFLISGLGWGYKPILTTLLGETQPSDGREPVESVTDVSKFPSAFVDFSGSGPIATTTIVQGRDAVLQTQILDQISQTYTAGQQVFANLGGEISRPDENGFLELNAPFQRPQVELLEISSSSFLKTLLSITSDPKTVPDEIVLFTERDIYSLLKDVSVELNFQRPIVFGKLRPEDESQFKVEVVDYRGKTLDGAPVYYFEETDDGAQLNPNLKHSDGVSQNFVVGNLMPGEYHLRLKRVTDGKIFATQTLRTRANTISLIQF
jgi:hypothetical protein